MTQYPVESLDGVFGVFERTVLLQGRSRVRLDTISSAENVLDIEACVEIVDVARIKADEHERRRQQVRAANQRWRERHPDAYHAAQRRWREKDPAHTRESARRNARNALESKRRQDADTSN